MSTHPRIALETAPVLWTPHPGAGACRVCGCREVHTDEVVDREVLLLAECPRCQQRWIQVLRVEPGAPGMLPVRVARRVPGEVASAA